MYPDIISQTLTFSDTALMLGAATPVVRFEARGRPVDTERLCGLLSVAFRQTPCDRDLAAVTSAASHWQDGAKALANLRLVFAGLPRLEEPEDILRLKAAELLFDAGLTADDLDQSLPPSSSDSGVAKFDSNEPRVPAGNADGGQWTKGIWGRFSAWLDEQVPIYDQDTGIQVGTQSRARAIATNPLTVATAGTAALLGGEALLPAAAPAAAETPAAGVPVTQEGETLTALAQRYLSTSGGRLGSTTTRRQLYDLAQEQQATGRYVRIQGDGHGPEEFLRDPVTGKGTYVDLTLKAADGSAVRIQTVDTLTDGVTPTARELAAAARIRTLRPSDKLILIPKR